MFSVNQNMNILFYDSEYTGHHSEYVIHLTSYINKTLSNNVRVHFLLPRYFASKDVIDFGVNITVYYLSEDELNIKQGRWDLLLRSKQETRNILKYGRNLKIDKVFCLNFNPFLLANFAIKTIFPFEVYGIYFHPFNRLEFLKGGKLLDKIRYTQKMLFIKRLISNKQVKKVYVLNDASGVNELNRICETNKFQWLPDPINLSKHDNCSIGSAERKVFLFFGFINKRKGILNFLQGVKNLDFSYLNCLEIRIKGQVDPDIIDELELVCDELRKTPVLINIKSQFLSKEELIAEVSNCDLILMPYLRVEGSSGLLGWAANFKKPVLGPKDGLIGELIRDYKFGISVDCGNTNEIGKGVVKYLEGDYELDSELQNKYCSERHPNEFARIIMNEMIV